MSTSRAYRTIDVKTGRMTKVAAGAGKRWPQHQGSDCWWVLTMCEATGYSDHTIEVCACRIGPWFSSPVWPMMAFSDEKSALLWFDKMRKFLKSTPPKEHPYDREAGGDPVIVAWLKEQGFQRYNHIWWKLPTDTTTTTTTTDTKEA